MNLNIKIIKAMTKNLFVIGEGQLPTSLVVECLHLLTFTEIVLMSQIAINYSDSIKRYLSKIIRLVVNSSDVSAIPLLHLCTNLKIFRIINPYKSIPLHTSLVMIIGAVIGAS